MLRAVKSLRCRRVANMAVGLKTHPRLVITRSSVAPRRKNGFCHLAIENDDRDLHTRTQARCLLRRLRDSPLSCDASVKVVWVRQLFLRCYTHAHCEFLHKNTKFRSFLTEKSMKITQNHIKTLIFINIVYFCGVYH